MTSVGQGADTYSIIGGRLTVPCSAAREKYTSAGAARYGQLSSNSVSHQSAGPVVSGSFSRFSTFWRSLDLSQPAHATLPVQGTSFVSAPW